MRDLAARAPIVGESAQRYLPIVQIPIALMPQLPTGLQSPGDGHVTVKYPANESTPAPSLKLAWEYNPTADAAATGDLSDWKDKAAQRGSPFTVWRTDRNPDMIQRVSGTVDQLPSSFFPPSDAPVDEIIRSLEKGSDLLTAAGEKAEMDAWERVNAGILDPRITVDEAEIVISFARLLPRL